MKPETFNYNDYLRLQSEMDKHNEYANALIAEVEQLRSQLATVTAERDAAVEDLCVRCSEDCDLCIHNTYRNADCPNNYVGRCDCWEYCELKRSE